MPTFEPYESPNKECIVHPKPYYTSFTAKKLDDITKKLQVKYKIIPVKVIPKSSIDWMGIDLEGLKKTKLEQ